MRLDIAINSGGEETFIFNNILTPKGTIRHEVIGSTPVLYNVTFSNKSYISIAIVIRQVGDLVGTNISCAGETITLDYVSRNRSKKLIW